MKKYLFILIIFTFFGKNSLAQSLLDGRNVVTSAVPFLMIAPDSRAGGMGDVGVATSPDANSSFWNAAKLAFIDENFGMSLSYVPWLRALVPDMNLSYLTFYKRIDKQSTFGGSLRYFSLGDITFTNNQGTFIGDFRPNELAIDGIYARKLSEDLSIGVALRYIHSNLSGNVPLDGGQETKPGNTVAGDINMYWQKTISVKDKDSKLALGINISNIGSKITYTDETDRDFIPINLRVGASYSMEIDEYNDVTFALDFNKLLIPTAPIYDLDSNGNAITGADGKLAVAYGINPDVPVLKGMFQSFYDAPAGFKEELREITTAIGIEYGYAKKFFARGGFFYEHQNKGNRQFISLGVGVKYNNFGIDFSYLIPTNNKTASQTSPLDKTMRFSMFMNFKKKNRKK